VGHSAPVGERHWLRTGAEVAVALVLVAAIGAVDYATGTELRVFPLYFTPVSLMAWRGGRRGTAVVAVLSALTWLFSNTSAGMDMGHPSVLAFNTLALGSSFLLVGLLMASLRRAQLKDRDLSRTDTLTQLLNSRGFYQQANRALEAMRRHGRPLTLAYVDLDHFKAVNDTLGHAAGDEVLQKVAEILRRSIRAVDDAARLGGDEFALLMPETTAEGAKVVLERVRAQVAALELPPACRVGASIGAVVFKTAPASVEKAVHAADERMYEVKTSGKNRVVVAEAA